MSETLKLKESGVPAAGVAPGRRKHHGTNRVTHPTQARVHLRPSRKMRQIPATAANFTLADHLRVQTAMENKAYELWLKDACDSRHRLDHWLRAEIQVLADFCLSPASQL